MRISVLLLLLASLILGEAQLSRAQSLFSVEKVLVEYHSTQTRAELVTIWTDFATAIEDKIWRSYRTRFGVRVRGDVRQKLKLVERGGNIWECRPKIYMLATTRNRIEMDRLVNYIVGEMKKLSTLKNSTRPVLFHYHLSTGAIDEVWVQ